MPEPKKQPPWWEGITTKEGWQGFLRQKEPLPEPQWFKNFQQWFMGRNQQRQPGAQTPAAPTTPTAQPMEGQPATAGKESLGQMIAPGLVRMPDGTYMDTQGNIVSPELAQRLYSEYWGQGQQGAGGQVPSWVTANQQAVMRTMARQYQGMEEQVSRAQQSQMETQWELQRQQMLGQLNSPADWIKRWMLQQKANPYKPQRLS